MKKLFRFVLTLCVVTMFFSSYFNISVNANCNELIFISNIYSYDYLNSIKNQYTEFNDIHLDMNKIVTYNTNYVVNINELRQDSQLMNVVNELIETNTIYFIGDATVKDLNDLLNIDIVFQCPIFDENDDYIEVNNAKLVGDSNFSVMAYSKNSTVERAVVTNKNNDEHIIATLRLFEDLNYIVTPYSYTIVKSGSGPKIYADASKNIYTSSNYTAYRISDSDSSADYYALRTNVWFNSNGLGMDIIHTCDPVSNPMTIDCKPISSSGTTAFSYSISGISVSYSGTKLKINLVQSDNRTNAWYVSDGSLLMLGLSSGDIMQCLTEFRVNQGAKPILTYRVRAVCQTGHGGYVATNIEIG